MSKCTDPKIGKLIHAYELNCIADDDLERFELHLLTCDYCVREIAGFKQQTSAMRCHPSIADLAGKVLSEGKKQWWRRAWQHLWPDTPLIFRPAVSIVVILLLVFTVWLGLRPSSPPAVSEFESVTLFPVRSTTVRIKLDRDHVLSFVVEDAKPNECYLLEMTDSSGEIIYHNAMFQGFDAHSTGRLLIRANSLESGPKHLLISKPAGDSSTPLQVYDFIIAP